MKIFDPIRAKLNLIRDDEFENAEYGELCILQLIRENDGITEDELLRELRRRFPGWSGEERAN